MQQTSHSRLFPAMFTFAAIILLAFLDIRTQEGAKLFRAFDTLHFCLVSYSHIYEALQSCLTRFGASPILLFTCQGWRREGVAIAEGCLIMHAHFLLQIS